MKHIEETEFINGIRLGDERIIEAFYKRNYQLVRKFVLLNSGREEDVEDVFQDSFVLIYQKMNGKELKINCSIHTYFMAICKNVWRNKLRRLHKVVSVEKLLFVEEQEPEIYEDFEKKEKEALYRKYFLRLDEDCKKLLSLVCDGKSMKEIAKITGYSEGYARKKKFECKKSLLEKIEKDPQYTELKSPSRN